jgi:hypothetical protein
MALYPVTKARTNADAGVKVRPAGNGTAPPFAEYRHHFPVGIRLGGDVDVYTPGSHDTTLNLNNNYNSGWRRWIQDPVIGLRENNFEYVDATSAQIGVGTGSSEWLGGSDPILPKIDTSTRTGKRFHLVFGTEAEQIIKDVLEDPTADYTDASAAVATYFAASSVETHRSIIAWQMGDDITTGHQGTQAIHLAHAFQDQDPYGRPCLYVCTDNNVWAADSDLRVGFTYAYPCGVRPDGDVSPEGDFHRSTYASVPDLGGGGADWVDAIRQRTAALPAGVPLWFHLQVHGNALMGGTGWSTSAIRKPTANEMRAMFWIAVAEGIKGLFWLTWGSNPGLTEGLAHISENVDRRAVASELSSRLTPSIRTALLECDLLRDVNGDVVDLFTATGGGLSGIDIPYPNAHITTQQHRKSGTYYVTVVNHSTSSASITLDSATEMGQFVNLETGERLPLGGAITLAGLDGTIFRFDTMTSSRIVPIDYSEHPDTRWARHWANGGNPDAVPPVPPSPWYIPSGTIPLHAHEVTVTPATIQQAIDDATIPTTFLLEPGYYGDDSIFIVNKSHLHFTCADPLDRPVVVQFIPIQTFKGFDYHVWAGNTKSTLDPEFMEGWNDGPRDLIFRGIDFRGIPEPPVETRTYDGTMSEISSWGSIGISARMVQDVLVEDCTFDEYVAPHIEAIDSYTASSFDYVQAPSGHLGLISTGSQCNHWVVRDCTFNGYIRGGNFGYPYAFFADGAHGNVLAECGTTGKFHIGEVLLLTNNDHEFDQDQDGIYSPHNERHGQFNVIYKNNFNQASGALRIRLRTGTTLIAENDFTINVAGSDIVFIEGQADPYNQTRWRHFYRFYTNVIRNNRIHCNLTNFVTTNANGGYANLSPANNTNPLRGRIGYTEVIDNDCDGTVSGSWLADASDTPTDGPDIITGNTPVSGTGR